MRRRRVRCIYKIKGCFILKSIDNNRSKSSNLYCVTIVLLLEVFIDYGKDHAIIYQYVVIGNNRSNSSNLSCVRIVMLLELFPIESDKDPALIY